VKVLLFLRKLVLGIPAQANGKNYAAANVAGGPAVLLHSLDIWQGASNIILAMTRRDVGKPAFSLRKKRFVKTHALSLLRTKNLRYAKAPLPRFSANVAFLQEITQWLDNQPDRCQVLRAEL
jgi:hypothetical protein